MRYGWPGIFAFGWLILLAGSGASAESVAPGVTDFSGARADAIQAADITAALVVPRGARIVPSAPPTVRLPIFFESNSTELRIDSKALLDKLAAALLSNELESFRFSVEGHSDSIGSASYNSSLSAERAAAVKRYLVARGVSADRLGTVGHGEAVPIADNDTDAGRERNRRVELINLGSLD